MKIIKNLNLIALIIIMLAFTGCASSYYTIGPYIVTFDGIEEYKHAIPESGPTFKVDSGVSYTGYDRTFLKENDKGSMTIEIDNYANQMYKDGQDSREVLKSLIELNDKALDFKPKGDEPKALDIKAKGLDSKDKGLGPKAKSLNLKALGEAVEGANSNRQSIAIWSPKISAVMWYLKKTIPEFSISEEARVILEEGLEKKYPELFQKVKEEMR